MQTSSVQIKTENAEETQAVAARLAQLLQAGDVLCLSGDLGAGKTTFTRGLVAALGIPAQAVTSPTFTLLHEYRGGTFPVYHADAYRLTHAVELDDIGLGEAMAEEDGITLIEWPERVAAALPDDRLDVSLEDTGEDHRTITFLPHGERWANLAKEWEALQLC